MKKLLRTLLAIPKPLITKEKALKIINQHCEEHGIAMKSPCVHERLKEWFVLLDGNSKSSRFFVVDNQSGEILREGQPPR